MALLWSWLLKLNDSPGVMLVVQQLLHWLGFGLIADSLWRAHMPGRAWAALSAGAFPVFLYYSKEIVKDIGMGSALVAGFAIAFWFLVQRKAIPWWAIVLSGLCIGYGALIRTNAVFALGPLMFLYTTRGRSLRLIKVLTCSIGIAVLAIPLSNWINHQLIGARSQDALRSLQLFDLMGIAARSGDPTVLGPEAPALADITACYTSYWWDPFSPWGRCARVSNQLSYVADGVYEVTPYVSERQRLWIHAILQHPLAYVEHRLSYFNCSIYWFVPSDPYRYSNGDDISRYGGHVSSRKDIYLDCIKRNFFLWPSFWICVAACVLLLLRNGPAEERLLVGCSQLLICSGLLYALAYLVVGVATETRYYYWSFMAFILGTLLSFPVIIAQLRAHRTRRHVLAIVILLVIGAGYVARLADVRLI